MPARRSPSCSPKEFDFITDWAVSVNPIIAAQGKTPTSLLYADHGVQFNASTFATTKSVIASKPEVVRGFLAATIKGIEEAIGDPPAAIDALVAGMFWRSPAIARS